MNRSNFDGEMIACPKCGEEYPSFYNECPYCDAERVSRAVIKHGRVRGKGELLGTLLLSLLLVAGGAYLAVSAVSSGGLDIGREYVVESAAPEVVRAGVTEQKISLSGEQSPVPEETSDETPGDGEADATQDPDADEDDASEE